MKTFKRGIVLLLTSFALMALLVACGSNGEGTQNNEDGKDVNKITVFQSKVEISEELEELAKVYEEETGVEVEVWGTTGDGYFAQLMTRLNSNQGPSIFNVSDIVEAQDIEPYLYDMSNEDYIEHIAPDMELEIDGKVVGLPYGVEGFGLIYNKDLINPEEITDLDSLVKVLEDFEEEGINGLQLSQEAYFLIGHISNYAFSVIEDNVEFMEKLSAGEVHLSDAEAFQEFAELMEAIREHTKNPLEVDYDAQIGDFVSGKTAMIHQGNWAISMFEDYDLDFEMGMMPVPVLGNDKLAVDVGSNWAVNGTKGEKEIEAANDFLNWLVTSETGEKFIIEEFSFIPPYTNMEPENLDPLSEEVYEATQSGNTIEWSHKYFPANLVVSDWVPAAEQFFLSDMSGIEFVDSLEEAWMSRVK